VIDDHPARLLGHVRAHAEGHQSDVRSPLTVGQRLAEGQQPVDHS